MASAPASSTTAEVMTRGLCTGTPRIESQNIDATGWRWCASLPMSVRNNQARCRSASDGSAPAPTTACRSSRPRSDGGRASISYRLTHRESRKPRHPRLRPARPSPPTESMRSTPRVISPGGPPLRAEPARRCRPGSSWARSSLRSAHSYAATPGSHLPMNGQARDVGSAHAELFRCLPVAGG
jgi:hypothetical protein